MLFSLSLTALSLVSAASAAFSSGGMTILAPGGDNLWWLEGQPNNLVWTCGESTFPQFTVWINNSDTSLLTAITPLINVEQNFNCNQGITPNLYNAPLGDGYTIVLSNINNVTDVYAVSDPFSIKALSVGYPPASATPVDQASATVSKGTASNQISSTGTGTGSASTAGATTKSNGAVATGRSGALVGALFAVAGAACLL